AAHLAPLLLRVGAEQCLRHDLLRLAPRLVEREHIGGTDLVLPLATALVGVALVVGLAAGLTHLKQESALTKVEEVGLATSGAACGLAHELRGQGHRRHDASTRNAGSPRSPASLSPTRPVACTKWL